MKKKELSKINQLFCGGIAGLISDSIAHPLDLVRARIVMQRKIKIYHYTGTMNAIKTIIRTDGLKGIYKGYFPVFVGTFPAHAVYFFSYEKAKRLTNTFLNKNSKTVSDDRFLVSLCAGFAADVVGSVLWCPVEVLKQNAMVWPGKTQVQVAREIFAREGFRGYYRGYFAGLWTFAPYVMLNFAFYEKFKSLSAHLLGKKDKNKLSPIVYFLCATSSSYISSLITTPLCVGRTRIQCLEDRKNTNLVKEMMTVIREDGWYALLEVWRTRALWFALGTATTFMVYEYMKNNVFLKKEEEDEY